MTVIAHLSLVNALTLSTGGLKAIKGKNLM